MSVANTVKKEIRPIHPGEMLWEDFLPDYLLTVAGLAEALAVSCQTVNELLRERRAVSPQMAMIMRSTWSDERCAASIGSHA